jgi:hypothetical protein
MIADVGFTVLRQIPAEYLAGLASKAYTLHGGVIRDGAGKILAHLAVPATAPLNLVPGLSFVPDLIQGYQLQVLGQELQKVMTLAMASTALSGLGLVATAGSTIYLTKRLDRIEDRIAQVKGWLMSATEGQLKSAVKNLSHAEAARDGQTRKALLHAAKSSFAEVAHLYLSQAGRATKLEEIENLEDYATTAMLGTVLCTSDLGLHDSAHEDMLTYHREWSGMARSHVKRMLALDEPSRLLDGRYVGLLPATELVSMLDFAHDQSRGIEWIDQLRTGFGKTTALTSALLTVDDATLRYARKLRARHDVFHGYSSHFEFLAAKRVSAGEFSKLVELQLQGHTGPALVVNSGASMNALSA